MEAETSTMRHLITERFENHEYVFEDFHSEFDLYKQGHKSRHDFYCDMATLFHGHQDLMAALKTLLTGSTEN